VKDSGRPANVVNGGQMASAAPGPPQHTQVFGSRVDEEATTETAIPVVSVPAATARLYILLPTGDAYERELTQAETQIGKGPRNDLVIADPAVSSAHAVIRAEGEHYIVSDLGSRNGTFVNGQRLAQLQRLEHGDVIGIGLSKLTFRRAGAGDTSTTLASDRTLVIQRAAPPPLTEESLANAVIAAGLASAAAPRVGSGRPRSSPQHRLQTAQHARRLSAPQESGRGSERVPSGVVLASSA